MAPRTPENLEEEVYSNRKTEKAKEKEQRKITEILEEKVDTDGKTKYKVKKKDDHRTYWIKEGTAKGSEALENYLNRKKGQTMITDRRFQEEGRRKGEDKEEGEKEDKGNEETSSSEQVSESELWEEEEKLEIINLRAFTYAASNSIFEEIIEYFKDFGCEIIRRECYYQAVEGGRGFGFIQFKTQNDYKRALAHRGKHTLSVAGGRKEKARQWESIDKARKGYITGLPSVKVNSILEQLLKNIIQAEDIEIAVSETGLAKGFGWAVFKSEEEKNMALEKSLSGALSIKGNRFRVLNYEGSKKPLLERESIQASPWEHRTNLESQTYSQERTVIDLTMKGQVGNTNPNNAPPMNPPHANQNYIHWSYLDQLSQAERESVIGGICNRYKIFPSPTQEPPTQNSIIPVNQILGIVKEEVKGMVRQELAESQRAMDSRMGRMENNMERILAHIVGGPTDSIPTTVSHTHQPTTQQQHQQQYQSYEVRYGDPLNPHLHTPRNAL